MIKRPKGQTISSIELSQWLCILRPVRLVFQQICSHGVCWPLPGFLSYYLTQWSPASCTPRTHWVIQNAPHSRHSTHWVTPWWLWSRIWQLLALSVPASGLLSLWDWPPMTSEQCVLVSGHLDTLYWPFCYSVCSWVVIWTVINCIWPSTI